MEHVGGGRDGIAAQVELQASLLGSSYEAVGRGLVAGDVHVASGLLDLGLYAIDVGSRRVGVVAIVIASLNDTDVGLGDGRLPGELLAQEVVGHIEVAAEEPAHQSESEHIAAL